MGNRRRDFLKTAGLGGAIAAAPALLAANQARASKDEPKNVRADNAMDLPKASLLCTLQRDGDFWLGVKTQRGVLDVEAASDYFDIDDVPETVDELLHEGGGREVEEVVEAALSAKGAERLFLKEDEIIFGPAVTEPEKIIMVGLNYRRHAAEMKAKIPELPILFNKYNNALLGHGRTVRLPTRVATEFDHEVELVIVIGRIARDVSEASALSYVAGYCSGNDVSARDLQRKSSQYMLGKTPDDFAPLGPWLVTADQIPNPNKLDIWCDVNGERRQSSNTADMIFNCAQLVSYCSQHMTLVPGDIIYTGTPEGVIAGKPEGKRIWLKPGDRISCGIEKLGELKFTFA
ncbi:MAG TPA: fumarylacetoacetate hydrolase family protein [Burkholderiales bacterium]|nr:fumarylacetoacetate hydrolase family protein [Burkholderiales bacterium]